jgi:DNA-directed RNA polymerase specialized sigma24 family protein
MLEQLAQRHNEWLKLAFKICKNKEYSKDLVQDMYLKIYNSGKQIEDINECYIYFIMRNQFLNEIKDEKRFVDFDVAILNEIDEEYNFIADIKEQVTIETLKKEFNKLTWYEKQMIDLTQEFGQRGLSRETGIHIQTIHNTTKKIKLKLWQNVQKKLKELNLP